MSYDIEVFDPTADPPADEAQFERWSERVYEEQRDREPTPRLGGFLDELGMDFRSYDEAPPELRDGAHYASIDVSGPVAYLGCGWSVAAEFEAAVHRLAVKRRIGFRDVSITRGALWFPSDIDWSTDPHRGFELKAEGQNDYADPSDALVAAALDWLGADRCPGFVILQSPDGSYAQVGCGVDGFVVECRLIPKRRLFGRPPKFWHGVAATSPDSRGPLATLVGHASTFAVGEGEVLTRQDARNILIGFAQGKGASSSFHWHDITDDLTSR